jgi:hypothetical protein
VGRVLRATFARAERVDLNRVGMVHLPSCQVERGRRRKVHGRRPSRPQGLEGVVQPRLRRPGGDREGVRDLPEAQVVGEAEEDFALRRRQTADFASEVVPGLPGGRLRGQLVGERVDVDRRPALPQARQREVRHRRIEEGGERARQPEARELPPEVGERLLEDVERVVAVAGDAMGEAHDPVAVADVERREGGLVASVRALDERFVRRRQAAWTLVKAAALPATTRRSPAASGRSGSGISYAGSPASCCTARTATP